MRNIKMLLENSKKTISFTAFAALLSCAGIIAANVYSSGANNYAKAGKIQGASELIAQLDRSIQSVKRREPVNKYLDAASSEKKNTTGAHKPTLSSRMVLKGVISDSREEMSIINDKIVKSGDRIEDFLVVDIKDGSVTLKDAKGEDKTIRLYEER